MSETFARLLIIRIPKSPSLTGEKQHKQTSNAVESVNIAVDMLQLASN